MADFSLLLEKLPMGWNNFCLGDICIRVQDNYQPDLNGNRLYLGLEHLAQGLPILAGRGKEADVKSSKNSFQANDVLFGKLRPYLRKCVLAQEPGVCSTDILVLRPQDKVLPAYLCYLCHSDQFIDYAKATTSGVQHPRTSWNSLREFRLTLPPLSEQRRIAHFLSTIQTAIEQQGWLIALIRELKSALMHKLFTEGLHGEKQKETEIGLVPESWHIVKLQDACRLIVDCPHTTPNFQPSGVRVARNFNIRNGRFAFEHAYFTTEDEYKQRIKRAEPQSGDILFSREAPVGEACLVPDNMRISLGQRTMLLKVDPNVLDAGFMVYSFYSPNVHRRMMSMASGLTVAHLNVSDVRNLAVAIPEMPEQIEIACHLTSIDEYVEILRTKKNLLEELFRTLLHQLMTGKVQVNDLDLSNFHN